jgi:hypothetical protein
MKIHLGSCAAIISFVLASQAVAGQFVHGYYHHNETYVHPHYRGDHNGTALDKYTSYRGNINPRTEGKRTNHYRHALISPYYTGPDSLGHVGHASSPQYAIEYDPGLSLRAAQDRDPPSSSLCRPPYRVTASDGCQK